MGCGVRVVWCVCVCLREMRALNADVCGARWFSDVMTILTVPCSPYTRCRRDESFMQH